MWIDKTLKYELSEDELENVIYDYYDDNITDADIVRYIEDTSKPNIVSICGVDFSVGEIIRQMDPTLFRYTRDGEIDYLTSEDMYELKRCSPEDGDSINKYIRAELDDGIVWKENEDDE